MTRTKTIAPRAVRHYVRNQSERRGPILGVAVHSTESQDIPHSNDDLVSIRNWFDNPASEASSHIGIDGDSFTEVWVPAERKAWTIGAANSFTLNIEFIGRAAQPAQAWEEAQIKQAARWVAYWSLRFGFPIQRGAVRNVNGLCVMSKKGVIRHSDVTAAGFGSHTDPGPAFPMAELLSQAQWFKRNGWTR